MAGDTPLQPLTAWSKNSATTALGCPNTFRPSRPHPDRRPDRASRARLCIAPFFFHAEDGIRDADVTGVQTCALPILGPEGGKEGGHLVFEGTPEALLNIPASYTGQYLAPYLKGK